MTKELFDNLLNGRGCATSSMFSVKDKDFIYSIMERYGMCRSTTYNRFFRDGFKKWELMGVSNAIHRFVQRKELDSSVLDNIELFFMNLDNKLEFKIYMNELSMGINTVVSHFTGWTFKEWEIVGVREIAERHFFGDDETIDQENE